MSDIKNLSAKDFESMYALTLYAFNKLDDPTRKESFETLYNHSKAWGLFSQGQLQSAMMGTPFEVNFHGAQYSAMCVGYVASYPEYGGKGSISQLMHAAFKEWQTQKVTLSYLAPFSYPFYRRFGYEQAFSLYEYQVLGQDLPKVKPVDPDAIQIKRKPLTEALNEIGPFFNHHPQNQAGGVVREQWWWQYLTIKHPNWETALAYTNDKLSGYVIYSRDVPAFNIHELFSANPDSTLAIWQFINKHQSGFDTFNFASSDPFDLQTIVPDPAKIKTSVVPYMMARIVNLTNFVRNYPFEHSLESMTINVTDDFVPDNAGSWQLQVHNEHVDWQPITTNTPNISISIEALTQAMLGTVSIFALADYGQVKGSKDALRDFNHALVKSKPMLWDYF